MKEGEREGGGERETERERVGDGDLRPEKLRNATVFFASSQSNRKFQKMRPLTSSALRPISIDGACLLLVQTGEKQRQCHQNFT